MLAMTNQDVAILILAAGRGTRLKSSLAKVLHAAGGRSLVEHVVRACEPLRAKKIIAVVGHQAEKVAAVLEPFEVTTVLQQPQNGTGHALLVAKGAIGNAKYVVVLPGDAPLVRTETLRALINKHKKGNAAASILTAVLADPSGYGRILRKSGDTVAAIIEESQLAPEQR
jgi:bifunctional N-acetylglucosamine-1-phosphate-uridyltransferase/glucosamine-1-phosphate-acetyltransferase GlmU-like protein